MTTAAVTAGLAASPVPRQTWNDVAGADPDVLVCQTPEWTDAVCASGRYRDVSRLYELSDGRRVVLPLVSPRRWPGPAAPAASFPSAWGIGGLIGPGIDREAIAAVLADLVQRPNVQIRVRPNPLHGPLWRDAAPDGVTLSARRAHVLDLAESVDGARAQLSKSARRAVKKAERAGLRVECDTTGARSQTLFDLTRQATERWAEKQNEPPALARWRHRQRDPIEKLHAIARSLGGAHRLWVAWLDDRAVAANLVLQGANAHATRGAVDPELGRSTGAGYLLDWCAIEDAARSGCRSYHLGESGTSASLAAYKERFGARPVDYWQVSIERLPVTRIDRALRSAVKRVIGFRDA